KVTKDAEFWFEDGTIILIAQNVEFRVYKGPLIRHSPVFSDMFSFPQPVFAPSAPLSSAFCYDETADFPVVHVTDSPYELRHVLRVFVSGDQLNPEYAEGPTIHAVAAWIRLGQKYQIDSLVNSGLEHLRRFYPDNAAGRWLVGPIPSNRPASLTGIHAVGVVNLARLTGEIRLLPTALLECASLGAEVVHGYEREDGSRELLGAEDLGRCFQAKGRLLQESASELTSILWSYGAGPGPDCRNKEECEKGLEGLCTMWSSSVLLRLRPDVLFVEGEAEHIVCDGAGRELCRECRWRIEREVCETRKTLWDALPRIFGLRIVGWKT
ncbi:uncharacterized protein TRAVEDRAFT_127519, partial [Trametes versicolor FP-101664 SS1]|uniref:uncharacterized protein n=1 Tax=Trametes versicolor (strain FP-101664) TaxID=717944 RepID=UPI00046238DF